MAQMVVSSPDDAMRALLALIVQDHGQTPLTFADPGEALRMLEESVVPLTAIFDVWLDTWDATAEARLLRFCHIATPHICIVLWDAHITLPLAVRKQFAQQRIRVVKKPLDLAQLDALLDEAVALVGRESTNPSSDPFFDALQ